LFRFVLKSGSKSFFSFPGCFIPVPANLSFEIEPQNDVTLSLVFTDNPGQKKERRQDENKEKLRENCFKIKCHFESSHSTYWWREKHVDYTYVNAYETLKVNWSKKMRETHRDTTKISL
jgi:hypothetical protein